MDKESFDDEFCDVLNGYLMSVMSTFDHKLARSCWMDGVLMPFVEYLSKKRINDTRKIETHVWALTDRGDIKFDLIIYFGKYSLRRYATFDSFFGGCDPGTCNVSCNTNDLKVRERRPTKY